MSKHAATTTATYTIYGQEIAVIITATYDGRYGTRHDIATVQAETIDGINYPAGTEFKGDIYSESDGYTPSIKF